MIKYALFASGHVGLETVKFCLGQENKPKFICISRSGQTNFNDAISAACKAVKEGVLINPSSCFLLDEALIHVDVVILAWWPHIIDEHRLAMPKFGWINFHPSLLPWGRGKHPNFWAIVDNRPFGVTLHWATKNLDRGPIIAQRAIEVSPEDTGKTLHERAQHEMIALFQEQWPKLSAGDFATTHVWPDRCGDYHNASEIDSASEIKLDACYSGRQLLNILRGREFDQYHAWFMEKGLRYEVSIRIAAASPAATPHR